MLDPFKDYLSQRWQEGIQNASQLWREIQTMGYPGTRKQVAQWAYERREHISKHLLQAKSNLSLFENLLTYPVSRLPVGLSGFF